MHVRALGVGLSYAIANAAFGGSAEYVALWAKSAGIETSFFWYVTAMCAIALVAAISMPDTRRQGQMSEEEAKLMEVQPCIAIDADPSIVGSRLRQNLASRSETGIAAPRCRSIKVAVGARPRFLSLDKA